MKAHWSCRVGRVGKASPLWLIALVWFFFAGTYAFADDIYVSLYSSGTILKFDSNGNQTVFASGLNRPYGLAFDSSGNLYVANGGDNTIEKIDTNGVGSLFATVDLSVLSDLAFDGSGNLFVSNPLSNTIERISATRVVSVFANTGLNKPTGLTFDNSGNLYVANSGDNTIEKFDTNGVGSVLITGLRTPNGLAFDTSGNLYVANEYPFLTIQTIEKFDTNRVGSWFCTRTPQTSEVGLAFDSGGYLYGAGGVSVEKFYPNGRGYVLGYAEGSTYLAVQIPEPTTWALVLLGVTVLVGSCRLRRRSS